MKAYILYNPIAGNGQMTEILEKVTESMAMDSDCLNMTEISDYSGLFQKLTQEDRLVIVGGDGTINHFVNATDELQIPCPVYYYPAGSGNDFARELGKTAEDGVFEITSYLKNLPTVEVRGRQSRFLNGIGYGIDGYCCEIGDELRKIPGKNINYTAIAIKGCLFDYVPTGAVVTVDGVRHEYKKVWIAPTMLGKCYGGGMYPTPDQDRMNQERKLSVMVFHDTGRLKTLMIFPSIFTGSHVKHEKYVDVFTGNEITVEFDSPRSLQVDGETYLNVRSYTAKSKPASQTDK